MNDIPADIVPAKLIPGVGLIHAVSEKPIEPESGRVVEIEGRTYDASGPVKMASDLKEVKLGEAEVSFTSTATLPDIEPVYEVTPAGTSFADRARASKSKGGYSYTL